MSTPFASLGRTLQKTAEYDVASDIYEGSPDSPLREEMSDVRRLGGRASMGLLGASQGLMAGRFLGDLTGSSRLAPLAGTAFGAYAGSALGDALVEDSARHDLKMLRQVAEELRDEHEARGDTYDLAAELHSKNPDTELRRRLAEQVPFRAKAQGGVLGGALGATLAATLLRNPSMLKTLAGAGAGVAAGTSLAGLSAVRDRSAARTLEAARRASNALGLKHPDEEDV